MATPVNSGGRFTWLLLRLVALLLVLLPGPSGAHLALIREGAESAGSPEANDWMGSSVATGDFNGDGFDDLAIGVPRDDNAGAQDGQFHGNVVISFGSAFGLTHAGAQYLMFTDDATDNDVRFGHALAAGDFNNDGWDDLAVGIPGRDVGASVDAGEVRVFEGGPGGLDAAPVVFRQSDAGGSDETGDLFGWSLACGDFDGNGVTDLGIGAAGEDGSAGAVFYILATDMVGLDPGGAGSGFFKQNQLGQTAQPGEQFGYALTAAHLLGSGHDDLAVGAPLDQSSGPIATGRVTLIPGSAAGPTATGSVNFNAVELGLVETANPHFGFSLAAGRIAHPAGFGGVVDLAVGSPAFMAGGLPDAGRVVIYQTGSPALSIDLESVPGAPLSRGQEDRFGWSVAAGDLDNDGFDELMVGAPLKDLGNPFAFNAGAVALFSYSVTDSVFPGSGSTVMDADWLFDSYRPLGLGYSLAFGQFDDSALGEFAIGSPFADYKTWVDLDLEPVEDNYIAQAGQVHIYAPHRQVFQLKSRSAALVDCEGNLFFSQRPFDPVPLASVTKIMTNWIASDHIVANPSDSNIVYTVPAFVAECVIGSTAYLSTGEEVKLIDLMKMLMSVSGNDAAFSIGDAVTGSAWVWPVGEWPGYCTKSADEIPAFIDSMNTRAANVGMTGTNFRNAAGLDWPLDGAVGRSTASDMAILTRHAMANPVFRYIVGTESWVIHRTIKGLVEYEVDFEYPFNFVKNMRARLPGAAVSGVKPGGTPKANVTGVATASQSGGPEVIATIFGVDDSGVLQGSARDKWRSDKLAAMLGLGLNNCAGQPGGVVPVIPPVDPSVDKSDIPTGPDTTGVAVDLDEVGDVVVEIHPDSVPNPDAEIGLCVQESIEYILDSGEIVTILVDPFQSQDGIRLSNNSAAGADLFITHNQPTGTGFALTMPAGADSLVVGPTAIPTGSFHMTIENTARAGRDTICVIYEGFKFDASIGSAPGNPWVVSFTASGDPERGHAMFRIDGKDPSPGNEVRLVVRSSEVATAVFPPGVTGQSPVGRLIQSVHACPNPFNPGTRIEYILRAPARVDIVIYDVAGRRVRDLDHNSVRREGINTVFWDGAANSGRRVASGVYFCRIAAGGDVRAQRLLILK